MRSGAPVALAFLLSSGTAFADNFCADIDRLSKAAQNGFTGPQTSLATAQSCLVSTNTMGRASYHCNWPFPFRDTAARATYNALGRSMRTCFSEATESAVDDGVNHPDSYEQRQFDLGHAGVRLSLKDKSQLGQTYVFVTIEGRDQ